MRILIADHDALGRSVLLRLLSAAGRCDVVVSGDDALRAIRDAHEHGAPYDLVCLDVMLPGPGDQDAIDRIRAYEAGRGIDGDDRVRVLVTTPRDEFHAVMAAFRGECEGYLVKPISEDALLEQLRAIGLPAPDPVPA